MKKLYKGKTGHIFYESVENRNIYEYFYWEHNIGNILYYFNRLANKNKKNTALFFSLFKNG